MQMKTVYTATEVARSSSALDAVIDVSCFLDFQRMKFHPHLRRKRTRNMLVLTMTLK